MITIYKYYLGPPIQIPQDAKILSVQAQGDGIYLWALVDTDKPTVTRVFTRIGTGWNLSDETDLFNQTYISTVQDRDGFVWHIFELQ